MSGPARLIYCHCAFAQVVPVKVKEAVLADLAASEVEFEAVTDLCAMSAKRDPKLKELADAAANGEELRIAACYPRAVRWLFHAAGAPLPESGVLIGNMRTHQAAEVVELLIDGKPIAADVPTEATGAPTQATDAPTQATGTNP